MKTDPTYGLVPVEEYRSIRILSPSPGVYGFSFGGGNTLLVPNMAAARATIDKAGGQYGDLNSDRELGSAISKGRFGVGWSLVSSTRRGSVYALAGTVVRAQPIQAAAYSGQLAEVAVATPGAIIPAVPTAVPGSDPDVVGGTLGAVFSSKPVQVGGSILVGIIAILAALYFIGRAD